MEKRTVGRPKSPRISDDDMKKIVIDQEETVMSVAALAKELGISTQAVRKRIERKLIPAHKKGRLWYILKSEYINAIRALVSVSAMPPCTHSFIIISLLPNQNL